MDKQQEINGKVLCLLSEIAQILVQSDAIHPMKGKYLKTCIDAIGKLVWPEPTQEDYENAAIAAKAAQSWDDQKEAIARKINHD